MEFEDLLRKILILNNNIKIIIITEDERKYEINKNIIKIINDSENYINEILNYLCTEKNKIKKENIIEEKINNKKIDNIEKKQIKNPKIIKVYKRKNTRKDNKKIISVIGYSGVR